MALIRQSEKPPGWGTRFARSFAEQLPGVAGNVLYQALGGLVREQFQKAAEEREKQRQLEQEQRRIEAQIEREKRAEQRYKAADERAAEQAKMRDVRRTMTPVPEQKLKFMAKPETYQAPATRAMAETAEAAVPQMAGAMAGAMTPMLPGRATRPEQAELQKRRQALKKATAGTGSPYEPPEERLGLDLSEPEMGRLTPAGRPMAPPVGALAGFGAGAMTKAGFAPRGTREAGIREAGLAMRGLPAAEEGLTAKQKEARDPQVRRARLQSIWEKLMADERRLRAKMQYKKYFSEQDRVKLTALRQSIERLNPFVIGGVVQPSANLPEMEELPYFRMTGGEGGLGTPPPPTGRTPRVAPPPNVGKKEWFDFLKAAARRGRTPQQAREDYRRKFGQ